MAPILLTALLRALNDLKDNLATRGSSGICSVAQRVDPTYCGVYRECSDLLVRIFRDWPEFSGNSVFPVPHPTMLECGAFVDYQERGKLWDENDDYGIARRELLDYCIHCVEEMLQGRSLL